MISFPWHVSIISEFRLSEDSLMSFDALTPHAALFVCLVSMLFDFEDGPSTCVQRGLGLIQASIWIKLHSNARGYMY